MKIIPIIPYFLLSVIILLGLLTYSIAGNYSAIIGYFTGTLNVNVTTPKGEFVHKPSPTPPVPVAVTPEIKPNFTVTPEIITTTLLQEQVKSLDLQINNTGNTKIDIKIELQDLSEFAVISESNFTLNLSETKLVRLDLFALSEQKPGIYIGKIVVKGDSIQRVVNVIIEVKERKPLFDIRIGILPEYKRVVAGGKLFALIQLENIGLRGKLVDVNLQFSIMDFDKKILFESYKETLAVGTQLSTIREFQVPSYTPAGKYLLIAEMRYNDITIDAYDTFDVIEEKETTMEKPAPTLGIELPNLWAIATLILIITVGVEVFLHYRKIKRLPLLAVKSRIRKKHRGYSISR